MKEEAIERLLGQGKRGARILSLMGRIEPLPRAFNTEIGKAILTDILNDTDVLLVRIIEEEADEKELAEYRVYRRILTRWSTKINAYIKTLEEG